ncbi:site-specific integrase [Massilia sp. 9I]|uniref:site-specific integrase n=1 Tax=Massilia sp. 9I TaxID=2653152 RepID=UPI0012F2A5BB|nr:site-specific integrase [Massilia sp. 9I]VXB32604.1 Integrase [Massilia sp. 9I]
MPMLPTGLVRDKKSGVYYLRRRIPTEILSQYPGKKEVTFSLKTKDSRTAVERLRREDAKLYAEWDKARERLARAAARWKLREVQRIDVLTPEIIDTICTHFEAGSLTVDEQRRKAGAYTVEDIEQYKASYAEANLELKMGVAIGDVDRMRPALEQFLSLYGYDVNVPEADMQRLTLAFARTAIRTNEKLLNRYEGKDEPTPNVVGTRLTPMLSEVTQAYIAYYEKLQKPAMLKKVKTVMPALLQVVGNKPIGSLTQSDILEFFDTVQCLPPRWSDVCRQRGITLRELAERRVGEMSKGTFDGTYMAAMAPFLKYCRGRWQDKGWPMTVTVEGIQYLGSRRDPEFGQRHFKQDELKRLFQGSEMAALAKSQTEAYKFWLPHVGLFSGARVNELCQVNPQLDIRQDEKSGFWFFDITEDSASHKDVEKSVKTKSSKRCVPIHPQLVELGFLRYVEHIKKQGHTLLFPGFPPSVGRASPKAGEWFGDFLRDLNLRDETPGARLVGMHAFRFTVLNQAAELGVVNAEAITGHSSNITNIARVQDGQIENNASAVVRTYRGELSVGKKMDILKQVVYANLKFHTPVPPQLT